MLFRSTGFTVNVTNYDGTNYVETGTVSSGSISFGAVTGTTWPLTITGLNPGDTATVTVTTTRTGYVTGTATYTYGALNAQSITFATIDTQTYGVADFALSATGGGSGNAVTFTSATTSVCTVSAGKVKVISVGTCTINANQASNSQYTAAPQVSRSFTVNPKALTIKANNIGVAKGDTITATSTITGLVSPDKVTDITYTYSGTGTSTPPATQGDYTITPSAAVFDTVTASSKYTKIGRAHV